MKALKLSFKIAWGTAKIAASVLFALAVPVMILCFVFAGGLLLLIPVALVGAAFAVVKACV